MFKWFSRSVLKSTKTALRSGQTVKERLKELERDHVKSLPEWTKRDRAIKLKYGTWNPTRKLDRQQIQELRNISKMLPHIKTIQLSEMFKVSPEAIRRILKSKWVPTDHDEDKLLERAEKKRMEKQQKSREFAMKKREEANKTNQEASDSSFANLQKKPASYRTNSGKKGVKKTRIGSTRHHARDMSELIE